MTGSFNTKKQRNAKNSHSIVSHSRAANRQTIRDGNTLQLMDDNQ